MKVKSLINSKIHFSVFITKLKMLYLDFNHKAKS